MKPSIEIARNIGYTQPKGAWFCLHIGSVAVFIGRKPPRGWAMGRRLELFTEYHRFRYSAVGPRLTQAQWDKRYPPRGDAA